jgi:hypothetical protein
MRLRRQTPRARQPVRTVDKRGCACAASAASVQSAAAAMASAPAPWSCPTTDSMRRATRARHHVEGEEPGPPGGETSRRTSLTIRSELNVAGRVGRHERGAGLGPGLDATGLVNEVRNATGVARAPVIVAPCHVDNPTPLPVKPSDRPGPGRCRVRYPTTLVTALAGSAMARCRSSMPMPSSPRSRCRSCRRG